MHQSVNGVRDSRGGANRLPLLGKLERSSNTQASQMDTAVHAHRLSWSL